MKTIEIFGNIYEEVEDNCFVSDCSSCDLLKICNLTKPDIPCVRADGSSNRHFVLVEDEKLNNKEENKL